MLVWRGGCGQVVGCCVPDMSCVPINLSPAGRLAMLLGDCVVPSELELGVSKLWEKLLPPLKLLPLCLRTEDKAR